MFDNKDSSPPPYVMKVNPAYSAQPTEYNQNAPATPEQSQVVVVPSSEPVVSDPASSKSFTCCVIIALTVVLMFNVPFGIIALSIARK